MRLLTLSPITVITMLVTALLVGLILLSVAVQQKKAVIRWHMPMAYADSNYHTQAAHGFARQVHECSGGELDIVIHSGGSLFKGSEIKRAVQTRQVPIGERLLSAHANENPLYAVDSIPFIATGFDDSDKLWRSAKPVFSDVMTEENLVLLYSIPWPPTGLYFKTPLDDISQLKRSRFRAYNASTARIAELAGMIPVQIEAAELNQALSTSVVESLMASGATGYDRKVWEQLDYYYDLRAWLPRNYVFANRDDFAQLSARHRDCVKQAALNAERGGTQKAKELSGWYIEQLKRNGMNIAAVDKGFKQQLAQLGEQMKNEWLARSGIEGKKILDAYQSGGSTEH